VALANAAGSHQGRSCRDEPLPDDSSASGPRSALPENCACCLNGGTEEKCGVPPRLVSSDEGNPRRHGTLVGWSDGLADLTEGAQTDNPASRWSSRPVPGKRVRRKLYQKASWSIYPSVYEGFGFPVVDSLRHGTPVLTSGNSSIREFQHEGVYLFDPRDAASVDVAWNRFRNHGNMVIDPSDLLERYDWGRVARTILSAHAESSEVKSGSIVIAA
jgi:hypothetical protein